MKITILSPHGFCGGVKNAIKIATNSNNKNEEICSLGYLIHNQNVIDDLKKNNIITIDSKDKTRLELLDEVKSSTILITAHGASPKVFEKARLLGLKIIDTTCPNVKEVHEKIINYLNSNYDVYYIGNKKHPETEGVLGISDKIKLIENIEDLNYKINDNSVVLNQTTLSAYDILDIHNKIKEINPNVTILNSICNATTLRQKALIDSELSDLYIIVGDRRSSNTKKLYEIAKTLGTSIMIESVSDLVKEDFTNINTVTLTSGASTPEYILDEVYEYLKKIN